MPVCRALLRFAAAIAVATALLPAHAAAQGGDDGEATPDDGEAVAYKVDIKGVPEDDLRELLRGASQLVGLKDDPPATEAGLRRRARDDVDRLRTALQSQSFYGAEVAVSIDTAPDPARVTLEVDTGPVYLLAGAEIIYTEPVSDRVTVPRTGRELGLKMGQRARSAPILAAQRQLLTRLENTGYPLAKVADRDVIVDHERTTLSVEWRIDPGAFVRFGGWELAGLKNVDPDYIRRFRKWQPGEPFDRRLVDKTRKALRETGLFASVRVERGAPVDGRLPLTFKFTESERRSIGFSGSFSTSEGPTVEGFWEHRNLLDRDQDLRLSATGGFIEQSVQARFTQPNFRRMDQDLSLSSEARRQDTEAFEEIAFTGAADVERPLAGPWRISVGTSGELTETEDAQGTRQFFVVGAPLSVARDTREDLLNPTQGSRISLTTQPVVTAVDETQAFLRNEAMGAVYRSVLGDDRLVLAGRARFGSIVAGETDDIPPSKRFFAGGGGSVRGFGFQEIGPLDAGNDPLGGRSLLEFSAEARVRIGESFGVVPFLDAGQVYDNRFPNLFRDPDRVLRYGAGLGLRYYTAIGPVRLDVAVPLNDRPVDDPFELYISLGQAF
ncbi:autotransporter secretion outer membrane protein TamA [Limimonas halophila]|uniref:Autotransporter secretion outer membrane protein TamA n=1 Tax=Limimonas halophila TaxID=1082479 RepID=A0A1G7UYT5_9PROT|nr:autotransporter assembly complex family protein [Limimonas halophila]SDG52451.1 autotransporter secretion outer membrane protein TamA [Limimonas halophila]